MKKILIVSPVVSHPALSGNSTRIAQMVASLAKLGCDIHFLLCPISVMKDRRHKNEMPEFYGDKYRQLNGGHVIKGGRARKIWSAAMRLGLRKFKAAQDTTITSGIFPQHAREEFSRLVDQIDPDVLIFEYVLMAELAASLPARRKKVVDTHDRFSNRNQRIRAAGGTGTWWSLSPAQEKRLLSHFDVAIAIQKEEHDVFTEVLGGSTTQVALLDILDAPNQHHHGNTPSNCVVGYIGSDNQHNIEGLFSFIDHHWPDILKAVPAAKLVVAGGISSERKIPGVDFVGRVGDLWDDFYKDCSIIVNPCMSGTGLKIKTVEAMSYGVPVVTTPEGCSGIESAIGQGLICHSMAADDYSKACIDLLQNHPLRSESSAKARSYIEGRIELSIETLRSIIGT